MQTWWKNPRLIGKLASIVMRVLCSTLQVNIIKSPNFDDNTTYLFAFWHGDQFLPAHLLRKIHKTPMCAMVSPSRDGAMLGVYLEGLGYDVIHGSSRDSGTKALIALVRKLQQGYSIGFGIDGPIGPIHIVKPGMIFLSRKSKVAIVPIGVGYSKSWTFHKAWDKFKLPKPFAKSVFVVGEPINFADDQDTKASCLELEKKIHQAVLEAQCKLNKVIN